MSENTSAEDLGFVCPLCSKPLRRYARRNDPSQHFWACTGYTEGCTFICDDADGEPFIKPCPECGRNLVRKISAKTGRPYVACFNKEEHASKDVIFFAEDGSVRTNEDQPKSKGIFHCPECGAELLYRRVRKGSFAGKKNVFLCPNAKQHKNGKTHFFDDDNGSPIL